MNIDLFVASLSEERMERLIDIFECGDDQALNNFLVESRLEVEGEMLKEYLSMLTDMKR